MLEPRHTLASICRAYSRAEFCDALRLTPADWTWAIWELKESGKVVQNGERRGARGALPSSSPHWVMETVTRTIEATASVSADLAPGPKIRRRPPPSGAVKAK